MSIRSIQDNALRYFYEVVRYGSISAAAQHLHVAASAISRQISSLEHSLGTPLFERHARGMIPNAAGEALAAHARRVFLDAEKTMQEIHALHGLNVGRVRIAASEGLATCFLPQRISEFRLRHQGILFDVNVQAPHIISEQLRKGEVDIGFQFTRLSEKDLQVLYRQDAPVLALVPPQHPLARSKRVNLATLLSYPLALPDVHTTVRQLLEVACSAQQLSLQPVLTSNNMNSLHQFVMAGGGVSVSAEISARHLLSKGLMQAVLIHEPVLMNRQIEVQVLAGRHLPHAVQTFVDFVLPQLQAR